MKSNSTPASRVFRVPATRNNKSIRLFSSVVISSVLLIFFFTTNAGAQGNDSYYPTLSFNSPVLKSGTDLQVGAVYTFPNVETGIDAEVTIMGMTGGAWLSEIDNTTGAGYWDAFQPYVGAGAYDTSYIDWKFVFKKAGTSIDTILPTLAVTGVDVDGDASALKEFIQAATPGSFALDPSTYLNFSFDGVRSTATSTIDNYPNIDTANRRSMFQMNFTNINTILYRNGAITTGGSQVRQTSIYFKSFFNWQTVLPVKLLSFDAKAGSAGTTINWAAADEESLKFYTVQKSKDSKEWKDIATVNPVIGRDNNSYSIVDKEENAGVVYYRLQQLDIDGSTTYSKTVRITANDASSSVIINSYASDYTINAQVKAKTGENYVFDVYTISGVKVKSSIAKVTAGISQHSIQIPSASGKGIYLLVVRDKSGKIIYNNKIPLI
ncbi:MAG: hypothetical protein QM764_19650 [Chitinophagaceae bacterium]